MSFPTTPGLLERIVYSLNMEVANQVDDEDLVPFELLTTGTDSTIIFLGYPIWCSEDEVLDEEATVEPAIRKAAMAFIEKLRMVAISPFSSASNLSRQ